MAQQHTPVKSEPALPVLQPDAAGLDIGSAEIWVCVPADRDAAPVRRFATYTPDLHQLADWLVACRITSVAMEATGVYWLPVFEILEARGLQVYLVNPHQLQHVPGRKSDIQDCQWIQRLHSYGLLTNSFQPEADMRALRSYLRQRSTLLEHRAAHIQHMQKALLQMNVQLMQAVDDITGQTGLTIIRAIVAGERDPQQLATHRQRNCAQSAADIAKALTGNYRAEHVFALKQALALYDTYTLQVQECDREIERQLQALTPQTDDALPPPSQRDKQQLAQQECAQLRCPRLALQSHRRGLVCHPRPRRNDRTADPVRNRRLGRRLSDGQTVLFLAHAGPTPRNLGRQDPAEARAQNRQSGGAGLPPGGANFGPQSGLRLGCLLSPYACPPWPRACDRGDRAQTRTHFLPYAQYRVPFDAGSAEAEEQRGRERKLKYLEREAAKYGLTMTASTPAPSPA